VGLVLPALPGVGGRLFVAIYADFILAINIFAAISPNDLRIYEAPKAFWWNDRRE
jgi:hypothetical protein